MEQSNSIKLFEDKNIRVAWNEDEENWYFSVVDIVAVLTDNDYQAGRKYWKTLKMRLNQEESELVTNCYQLKMKAHDGKLRDTDVMNTEQILRLVQSIPSKKAEPFKLWLAQVGKERIDEAYDPEITINRALDTYMELVLNMLAETSVAEISKSTNEQGVKGTEQSVIKGGNITKFAREQLEKETGKKVISGKNAKEIRQLGK